MTAIPPQLTLASSNLPVQSGASGRGDSSPFSSVLDRLQAAPSPQPRDNQTRAPGEPAPKPRPPKSEPPLLPESPDQTGVTADGDEASSFAAISMLLPEAAPLPPTEEMSGVDFEEPAVDESMADPTDASRADEQPETVGSDRPADHDQLSAERPATTISTTAEMGIERGEARAARAGDSDLTQSVESTTKAEPSPPISSTSKGNAAQGQSGPSAPEVRLPGGGRSETPRTADPMVDPARLSVVPDQNEAPAETTQQSSATQNVAAPSVPPSTPPEARPLAPPSAANGPATPQPPRPEMPLSTQVTHALAALKEAPNGEHTMTIRVHPEEYGPLLVRAHIGGDKVRIDLVAPTAEARDVLRASMADLRRELATVQLQADVNVQTSSRSAADDQRLASGFGGREQTTGNQRRDGPQSEETYNPHRRSSLPPRDIDTAAGIDLYI